MTPNNFVSVLLPYAKQCEAETGINALVILAQAALETGWGAHAPGNMYFGVKDIDGVNGNEQLVTTFEYSSKSDRTPHQLGLETIVKIEAVEINGKALFKYTGLAYFRKYQTPKESFVDHAQLFLRAVVYKEALKVKDKPEEFITEMAKHYATAPNYADLLIKLYRQIKKLCAN